MRRWSALLLAPLFLAAAPALAASQPASPATSQSLLLEAQKAGAATNSIGTVQWSEGVDDRGVPTLMGAVDIPDRGLRLLVTIVKNSDATLPATHLINVDFQPQETFGKTIGTLAGILAKNEELAQGKALIGASARVVGNSFVFALSAASDDARSNLDLMTHRSWLDLAIVYADGQHAMVVLGKDPAAQALFDRVIAEWNKNSAG